jgi:hypothetical protein
MMSSPWARVVINERPAARAPHAASCLQLHGFQSFIELNIRENAAKMIGRC